MSKKSRRDFLRDMAGSGVLLGCPSGFERTSEGVCPELDLVIKGGEVLDPSQGLRAFRDVGIRDARIVTLASEIPEAKGREILRASGKLVFPGLVDMHAHVYPGGTDLGLPPDEMVVHSATTTYVDAGSTGAGDISAFRRRCLAGVQSRILTFVNISKIGLKYSELGECLRLADLDVDAAARTLAEHQDVCLGIKVRQSREQVGEHGFEPLKRAIKAAELSGVAGARVMLHIGNTPGDLSKLLDLLRPGDILTHCYTGSGGTSVIRNGKLLPAALAAKQRGVIIDVGHGGGSFDYTVAEPAVDQGFDPDTISTDIHAFSVEKPGRPYMPWIMSKFLNMGFDLEQVVSRSTHAPARIADKVAGLGTLKPGAPADLSILELVEKDIDFVDSGFGGKRINKRSGKRYLKPYRAVTAGRVMKFHTNLKY
jgi:dihydroorotase